MDYPAFVRLREPVWDAFEARLAAARQDPGGLRHDDVEAMAFDYRQILHDHALVASRFPRTGAAVRLRRLAVQGTHWLHRDVTDRMPGLGHFLSRRFPRAFRALLPYQLAAAVLFLTALVFGSALAVVDAGVGTALLGPGTVEELKRGRLWTESLITTVPPAVSSSRIATNNMSVALAGWAGGALLGLGALYVVLLNGFLLGAIVATTVHYGLLGGLLEFIAAHGPLELTLILCTAGGGLAMGHALVAAGDEPRGQVVARASRDALVLLMGCLPWFLVLGVVEAVVSPAPAVPVVAKAALGLGLWGTFLLAAWNPRLEDAP